MSRQFLRSVFFKENWGNCSRQHVPRGNYKFKLRLPPGLAAVARLLRAACRSVNAPVVFLNFYFAARLWRRSRAACRIPYKRIFIYQFIKASPLLIDLLSQFIQWFGWQTEAVQYAGTNFSESWIKIQENYVFLKIQLTISQCCFK